MEIYCVRGRDTLQYTSLRRFVLFVRESFQIKRSVTKLLDISGKEDNHWSRIIIIIRCLFRQTSVQFRVGEHPTNMDDLNAANSNNFFGICIGQYRTLLSHLCRTNHGHDCGCNGVLGTNQTWNISYNVCTWSTPASAAGAPGTLAAAWRAALLFSWLLATVVSWISPQSSPLT